MAEARDAFIIASQVRDRPTFIDVLHPQSRARIQPRQRGLVAEAQNVAFQAFAVEPKARLGPISRESVLRDGPPDTLERLRVVTFPETQKQASNEMLQRIVCSRTVREDRFLKHALFPCGRRDRQGSELQEDVIAEVLAQQVVFAVLLVTRLGARGLVVPDAQR